jgi:hypothetical protein
VLKELEARYEAGNDTPILSREHGISKTGLIQLLQAEGVSMWRQTITPEDAEKAMQLYERGLTMKKAVRQVG